MGGRKKLEVRIMKDEVGEEGLTTKYTKGGEAPESAASAVVFLSADVWAWVELGKPLIRGKKRISRKAAKPPREEGWGSEKDEL